MKKNDEGQVALIVVLILVVLGVIVLSVVSRSIADLRLASIEESASSALRAAEAGIEESLRNISSGNQVGGDLNQASFTATTDTEGADGLVTPASLSTGEVVEVALEGSASPPTSVDIYWGDRNEPTEQPAGAVEVIKYQKWSDSDYRTVHEAYDPDATRVTTNNFVAATVNPGTFKDINFAAKTNVTLVPQDVYLRIRMFYTQGKVAIAPLPGGTSLPDQVYRVVSVGSTADGVVRRVEAVRTLPVLPIVFDAVLYSGGSLTQQ